MSLKPFKPVVTRRFHRGTIEQLSGIERIIADELIREGQWIIIEDEKSRII